VRKVTAKFCKTNDNTLQTLARVTNKNLLSDSVNMRMRTLDMKVLSLEQPSARERIPLAVIMSHHEMLMLVS
jgi:hypothetical protein